MDLTGGRRPIVAGAEDVYRGGDRIWNPSSAATAANSPPAAPHGPYPLVVPTSDLSPAALGVLKPRVMGGLEWRGFRISGGTGRLKIGLGPIVCNG